MADHGAAQASNARNASVLQSNHGIHGESLIEKSWLVDIPVSPGLSTYHTIIYTINMKKPEIVDGHLKKDIGIGCVTYRQIKTGLL